MPMKNLKQLFIDELKDIYDAEQRITKALPKMVKAANSEDLSSALENHLEETQEHVARLEQIFKNLNVSVGRKTCQAMVGLLEEGQSLMDEKGAQSVMDAALIAAAQKVEHYEMATYGCLRDWAQLLGDDSSAELLQQTLDEEGEADQKLTEIAQLLNFEALEGEDEERGERETVSVGRPAGGVNRPGNKSRTR